MSNSKVALAISFVISIGAILLLFQGIDFDQFTQQLQDADLRYIVATLAVYPFGMTARAMRWQTLFKTPLAYWRGFHIINIGYLFNVVLPFRAGEFIRIILTTREPEQNMGSAVSAATVERLFDLMMALFCLGIGLALIPESSGLPQDVTSSIGVFITITIIGMGVLLFLPNSHPTLLRIATLVLKPFPDFMGSRLLTFATDTLDSLKAISSLSRLLRVLVWSTITWTTYVTFFYIGLLGFFSDTPPLSVGFLVTGFVAIGIAAPSLPGAVGVFQAAAVLALNTAGYEPEIATGYAWVVWISQTIVIILSGIASLSAMSLTFGELSQEVRQEQQASHHLES